MSKSHARTALIATSFLLLTISPHYVRADVDLSPAGWDEGEIEKYLVLENAFGQDKPLATGTSGLISGSSSALAMRAGLEALKQGGSAVDAALAGAMTQIVMNAGATVSYAGVLEMVYYDAATGKVYALDAGFNTVQDEDDPLSIPLASYMTPDQKAEPGPRGRTVMAPGFMAGVEVAHRRFGKLPFDQIFQPAIYFAEEGFPISPRLARWINRRKDILSRLPETKAVFTNEGGDFHAQGDLFTQPALAQTLRAVAKDGASYMYTGVWAERFVEAVRKDGGKLSMEDLADYELNWSEPLHVAYREYDIYTNPNAFALAGAMNLLEHADLSARGHYTESPETFVWLTRILRTVRVHPTLGAFVSGGRPQDWLKEDVVANVWEHMQSDADPSDPEAVGNGSGHSSSIVAVDRDGNVATVLHSINTVIWGESGLIVDGVSIPDAACFQQQLIMDTGPGKRLPNATEPLIVLTEGRPVLAASAIGSAIDYETIKVLFNALDFGMNPKQAGDAAHVLASLDDRERVLQDEYGEDLVLGVRDLGIELEVVDARSASRYRGYAVILAIDIETGILTGSAPTTYNGAALAY
ncbi:MAG: gamma-glutamyltransferase [Phycisphaerales bacterium]|nr:gamma-glutamyltransferase [Phycisphaerales bacterium]